MDEDSPWGAPSFPSSSSSPPKPSSSSYSPPPSAELPRFNSSWGADDNGGGWGNGTNEQEEYGSFGGNPREDDLNNDVRNGSIERKESIGDAWGASHDSPELPKLLLPSTSKPEETALEPSEPLDLDDDSRIQSNERSEATQDVNEEPEDDRGWAPSTPPLPPISTLEISSSNTSPSTNSTTKPIHTTWDPGALDEPDLAPPPPLPSVNDLFATSQNNTRKESVGDGEEAWGAATNWEERQEKERMWEQGERDEIEKEIERKVREAEEAAERGEESWGVNSSGVGKSISAAHVNGLKEDSRNFAKQNWNPTTNQFEPDMTPEEPDVLPESVEPPASESISNDTPLPSLFKFPNFRAGLDKTAAKSNETLKGTTSSLRNAKIGYTGKEREKDGMTSVEDGNKGHQGDEYDVDAPGRSAPAKSSWWGRSGGGDAQKKEDGQEGNTVGAQEVGEGESGKTEDQQVGTIGRLFSRFKKNAPAPSSSDAGSTRSSGEVTRSSAKQEQPTWKDEDFDALGSGRLGSSVNQVQPEEQDLDDPLGGFFGDKSAGRGSLKNRSRVPTAPPEDDFGGLLGSFSTAPVTAQTSKSRSNKPFDPFDPLSEPSPPRNVHSASSSTLKRPTSNISFPALSAPPAHSQSSAPNTEDDSFDAFFDSVTSSIPKPPLSSIPTPPLPSSSSSNQQRPSILLPKSTAPKRTSLASPIPRISSASPPIRSPVTLTSLPSSSNSSRATTPILPLAPPPPPSQPLSQRNNLLGGSLAPPPAPSQPISRPVSTSPPPSNPLSPIPPSLSARASPLNAIKTAPVPPTRTNSGPLSQDDLSFFENL